MKTFTAQDMKDYGDYVATLDSAMLSPNFEKWCRERFEPAKKIIDLSVLIDSQIELRGAASALEEYISSSSSIEMLFTEDGDCPLTKLRIALGVSQ